MSTSSQRQDQSEYIIVPLAASISTVACPRLPDASVTANETVHTSGHGRGLQFSTPRFASSRTGVVAEFPAATCSATATACALSTNFGVGGASDPDGVGPGVGFAGDPAGVEPGLAAQPPVAKATATIATTVRPHL